MIEFSFTELVFLCWGAVATASWLNAREEARVARKMLMLFIENKEAREQLIQAHEKFLRENGQ